MQDPINIRLIEDDARAALFTKKYLEQNDMRVEHTDDGMLGQQKAMHESFDAIVLDIMLPHVDGISICKQTRLHSDVPIIIVTARQDEADRVIGLEVGADDYLVKPFSARELSRLARTRDGGAAAPIELAAHRRSAPRHHCPYQYAWPRHHRHHPLARCIIVSQLTRTQTKLNLRHLNQYQLLRTRLT